MSRAFLLVLDSVGIGGAPDAEAFGDAGADTLGHIAAACAAGACDRPGLRAGPLDLPFLAAHGLGEAAELASGHRPAGLAPASDGQWGCATERSRGKDTPTGHWEIAGAPLIEGFGLFPPTDPAFSPELVAAICREGGVPGILGNRHSAGVPIMDELGAEHMRTGAPICYTSVDSVFQIAAHEETFGLERLYDLCRVVRRLLDPLRIGRVIARPFVGTPEAGFSRTPRRKDFAMPPPPGTLLDRAASAGRDVVSLGKIGDIFAHRATGREVRGPSNMALFDSLLEVVPTLAEGGLAFANFVDFDTEFGHLRDAGGYAAALEAFDARLPQLAALLRPGDLAIVTADHGNDPTFRGTDHTRERLPIVAFGPGLAGGSVGRRASLADIGETVAAHLGLPGGPAGTSWLDPQGRLAPVT